MEDRTKSWLIIGISLIAIIGFFLIAQNIPEDSLEKLGGSLSLPVFTFLIALVDGFNPCTLFILTMLLGLMISVSHSRKKIFIVGYTFAIVVMGFYFLFMLAWLNIFQLIGFVAPLRFAIAALAIGAGLINCKELFFFRKGFTLMIQEKHKAPLVRKIQAMKDVITKGSTLAIILASIVLAIFSSLIELPCTAGFPIIYASILATKGFGSGFMHILFLLFYTAVYILPLTAVITLFGFTFKNRQISKHQMQIIKYIGGFIMILLGIILLVNPGLLVMG
jgi:cytochrome c biogenesis protein CcdA